LNNRGISLHELGRHDESLDSYDKALAIKPDYADAWFFRGISLHELGRHDESLNSYDKAIELDPKFAPAWNYKGDALKELKRFEEAVAAYDRAIQLDPQNESAVAGKNELLTKIHSEQQNREKEERKNLIQHNKKTESSVVLPPPIKDTLLQPDAQPDKVTTIIRKHDESRATPRPHINFEFLYEQVEVIYDKWVLGKKTIAITNVGSAHAKNVTFEFSDEVKSTTPNETLEIPVGKTQRLEIPIKAKVKDSAPIVITVIYYDQYGKQYKEPHNSQITVKEEVKEKLTQNESAFLGKNAPSSQTIINNTYAADVHYGPETTAGLMREVTIGGSPMENKVCPHCNEKIDDIEIFCSHCGTELIR